MFGLFCKGLHCAGCKSPAGMIGVIIIGMACLIAGPTVLAVVGPVLIWCACIIGGSFILSGIAYAIVSKFCEHHMVYVRGRNYITMEARDEQQGYLYRPRRELGVGYPQIPSRNINSILPRYANERQEERQFIILERRDER